VIVLVAGTGTGVGKTFVAAAVVRALRERGFAVSVRKPVQSFSAGDTGTDAELLASASGEDPHTVCPPHRWIPAAMAPPIAAGKLGLPPFTTEELVRELAAPDHGLTVVESVGGVRSPISSDGDTTDLADAIDPALVLLVADAGLGTINAVRLSLDALARHRVVVFLNRFDPNDEVHVENAEWLRSRHTVATLTSLDALVATVSDLLRPAAPVAPEA
jgi:dethiobiotin synthetase